MSRRLGLLGAAAGALSLVAVPSLTLLANPVADLPGRWAGWGSVTLSSGTNEQVKCVATYFRKDGGQLQQNLRCASTSYNIDASADLVVQGTQITGSWREKRYEAKGSVTGKVTDNGFAVRIQGETFSAEMTAVVASRCKQQLSILPKGLDVTKITMSLCKC